MSSSLAHGFRSLSRQPPPDPDIQATLSDFLTYTEHYPAYLTRALALIQEQRVRTETKIASLHHDTCIYSNASLDSERPDLVELRKRISYALEDAEAAARMADEEAKRLDDVSQREWRKLDVVMEKLKAQPQPPSRDPTPSREDQQQPLTSPNLKRERRMSVRGEEQKMDRASRKLLDKAATKLRGRKVMVPGEVLPPPDPNAPVESMSDWTSPRASPPMEEPPIHDKKATPRPRSRTPKPPKRELERKTPKPRAPRQPGQPGTNAHSAVAGISTSNALLALTEPPEDAQKGSKWLPWMKLTEWEMAKLRKRMKKNAIWVPSQTMVRRELKNLGRGVAGREAARTAAENSGPPFIDETSEKDPTSVVLSGEDAAQISAMLGSELLYADEDGDDQDQELINRGMRLNEAKKLKRQRMQEEAALQAQLAREQGIDAPAGDGKKRKRESTPNPTTATAAAVLDTPDPLSKPGPAPKKLKINPPAAVSTKVPLAPAGSPAKTSNRAQRAATPPVRRPTITIKAGKAVSEEPPNRRANLRRNSNVSLPNNSRVSPARTSAAPTTVGKTINRRSRRPAPGILTTADDESAKVGVSKRKAAPRKKGANRNSTSSNPTVDTSVAAETLAEEIIDPDEPRYCICGDVSWGTMIACDNDDCDKEWFHLACVQLDELPPRRTKWYCPDCRKKLKLGQGTNGLVGRTGPVGGR